MSRAIRRGLLALAVGTLAVGVLASGSTSARGAQAPDDPTQPVRRALLIGVNDYLANDVTDSGGGPWTPADLRGAVNDVEMMRAVLTSRFGFEDGRIRTLTDKAATRAAILQAMRQLVGEAKPGDVVYIHFSGHGSQVKDTDGDETDDGLDETILPHDARTGEITDITDDEIGELLSNLRTGNALIVLDSCHAGTATRNVGAVRTRMVAPDPRTKLYENKKKLTTRSVGSAGAEFVLMTGAASHQSALDGPLDGEFYGFFSYALGKSLGSAPAGASARDVHARVLKEFERISAHFGLVAMPEPQLEASAELADRPVLRAAAAAAAEPEPARLAWVEFQSSAPGRGVLLGGVRLGARPGGMWAIYPPGDTGFVPGMALATATVVGTTGDDAVVQVEPAQAKLPAGCRAVALAPPPASARVPIHLDRVDPEIRPSLERALRKLGPAVQMVGADEFARFIVDVEGGSCRVFGAGGLQEVATFPANDAEQTAGKLAEIVSRSSNASALLALDNPSSALRLDVRVLPADEDGATRAIKVVGASDAPAYRIRRSGEPRSRANSLMLEVTASADCYLTVIDVDTEGGINILFPNTAMKEGYYPDGLIPGGRTVQLPDSLQRGNKAGFFWDYGPPAGVDHVRAFAMTDLEMARQLRAYIESIRRATATRGQGPVGTRGAETEQPSFTALARQLAESVTTRGITVVADTGPQVSPSSPTGQAAPASSPTGQAAPASTNVSVPASLEPQAEMIRVPDWTATSVTLLVEE